MNKYFYLVLLGILEIISLSITRAISIGTLHQKWLYLSIGCSSLLPVVFLLLLLDSTVTLPSANLLWDLSSGIIIIFIGLYFFKETITNKQTIGILLALLALILIN